MMMSQVTPVSCFSELISKLTYDYILEELPSMFQIVYNFDNKVYTFDKITAFCSISKTFEHLADI